MLQHSAKTDIHVHALVSHLKSCTRQRDLQKGRRIHTNAIETQIDSNIYVAAALINMYAKCSSMVDARMVFDRIKEPNVVSWNALILGYVNNGHGLVALDLFSRMKNEGCAPSSVTYIAVIKACTSLAAAGGDGIRCLQRGRGIHLEIGCHMNHFVQTTLIEMYAKCGSMVDARTVFDSIQEPDVVSWTAVILGYAENGKGLTALDLFSRMKEGSRSSPDSMSYVAALKACTSLAADGDEQACLERGIEIHLEVGCRVDLFVQNTLLDMYAKCSSMVDARTVFEGIQKPDVVTWTALILGYVDNGQNFVALDLFARMKSSGCEPNSVTYTAVLKACGSIGALAIGRKFHSEIRDFDAHVVTCLVDFYANCASIEEAREVFEVHPGARNSATWNALLAGYCSFGDTASVFGLFEVMQDQRFQANALTFLCILSCCAQATMVDTAREYLKVMLTRYGVTPTVRHYTCMIDILGRANKLDEAVAVIREMPCEADGVTWMTLLGACRKWKNSEIGRFAFESLLDMDPRNASAYILMVEVYGSRGMWVEQESLLDWSKPSVQVLLHASSPFTALPRPVRPSAVP